MPGTPVNSLPASGQTMAEPGRSSYRLEGVRPDLLTRRNFLRLCLKSAASLGLSQVLVPGLAEALRARGERPPVLFMELMTCAGNLMSWLNSLDPRIGELLLKTVDLRYQNTIMAGEGEVALRALEETAEKERGNFHLLVEGTVPLKANGLYGAIGHRANGEPLTMLEVVKFLGDRARSVVAVGTCASFGGPYAANPNPSGSVPLDAVLDRKIIKVPGCPIHPDWLTVTLGHLLLFGIPDLDREGRPRIIYGDTIHDNCPRRQHFENSVFARYPGDGGCLYRLGCKGPVTFTDCPTRQWSGAHNNWPVEANTPCIGCVTPGFPDRMAPFFEHLPDVDLPAVAPRARGIGLFVGTAAAAGIGSHLAGNILSGRLRRNWVEGTEARHVHLPDKEGKVEPRPHTPPPQVHPPMEKEQRAGDPGHLPEGRDHPPDGQEAPP